MYCPKCSKQQISDETRFCSSCGFQLNVVKALLASNDDSSSKTSEFIAADGSRRKKDMIIGAVLMFVFAFHTAWTTEDLSLEREFTSLIVKCLVLCVLINLIPMVRDYFRHRAAQHSFALPGIISNVTARFSDDGQNRALPHARTNSAADYFTGGIDTAEFLTPPPSVTERTTNLLRNNQN